ncbi:transcriptional regulator, partial [Streptomyces sp. B1866]|nr:transcriptional regulator [Streptomyces sp. B1866]
PEPPEPGPGPAPGRRRRRARLLAGAVAALAVAVLAPEAFDKAVTGAGDRADPAGGASPTAARGAREPRSAAPETGPAPFHTDVLANNWDTPCDQWFLLDKAPRDVPPPPAGPGADAWAAALGAVPAGHLRLQVTVQGTEDRPVVLHALYVHVVSSRKARPGNAYTMGAGCGGGLTPGSFAIDLDAPGPRPRAVAGRAEDGKEVRATGFPYKASAEDPQVLNIDAATGGRDVTWYLSLAWSSGSRHGVARVDDHGRPFRTAGMRGDPAYWYGDAGDGGLAWIPYG